MTSDQVEYQRSYYDSHFPKRAAVTADQLAHPLFRSFYDRLAALVVQRGTAGRQLGSPERPLRFLEVACGEGLLGAAVHRLAGERGLTLAYTGTDLSQGALDLARPSVTGELLAGDAVEVVAGLEPGSQDVAVVKNLLHHLDDPASLMAAAGRAVGPEGRVVVVEACLGAPQFWAFTLLAPRRERYFFLGRRRNLAAIAAGGMDVVATERFSWLPYELAFAIRFDWFRRLLATGDPDRLGSVTRLDEALTRRLGPLASYIVWTTAPRAP